MSDNQSAEMNKNAYCSACHLQGIDEYKPVFEALLSKLNTYLVYSITNDPIRWI